MLHGNSRIIRKALEGYHVITNPAIKENLSFGRPKSGMFIAVPSSIKSQIKDVSPKHPRVQAICLRSENSNILIINSYFPTDANAPLNSQISDDLEETLFCIETVLANNDYTQVFLTGDINCNFLKQTMHVKNVSFFRQESPLKSMGYFQH